MALNPYLYYEYLPGDANMPFISTWPPEVSEADVIYLVNYFKIINSPCLLDGFYASADINGDCKVIGSDVTRLVNYFRGMNEISYCQEYLTLWPTPMQIPSSPPSGWPNCDQPLTSKQGEIKPISGGQFEIKPKP
jgi:hypothetical protein